jgi:hypothetical protein
MPIYMLIAIYIELLNTRLRFARSLGAPKERLHGFNLGANHSGPGDKLP